MASLGREETLRVLGPQWVYEKWLDNLVGDLRDTFPNVRFRTRQLKTDDAPQRPGLTEEVRLPGRPGEELVAFEVILSALPGSQESMFFGLSGPMVTMTNLFESLVVREGPPEEHELVEGHEEDEEGEEEEEEPYEPEFLQMRQSSMQDDLTASERVRVPLGTDLQEEQWTKILVILDEEMQKDGDGLSYSVRSNRSSLLLHGSLERITRARNRILSLLDPSSEPITIDSTPSLESIPEGVVPVVDWQDPASAPLLTPSLSSRSISSPDMNDQVNEPDHEHDEAPQTAPVLPGSLRWASEEERVLTEHLLAESARGSPLARYKLVIMEILKALPGKKVLVSSTLGLLMKQAAGGHPHYNPNTCRKAWKELVEQGYLIKDGLYISFAHPDRFGWLSRYELHLLRELVLSRSHRVSKKDLLDSLAARFSEPTSSHSRPRLILSRRVPQGFSRILISTDLPMDKMFTATVSALLTRGQGVREENDGFLVWAPEEEEADVGELLRTDSMLPPLTTGNSSPSPQSSSLRPTFSDLDMKPKDLSSMNGASSMTGSTTFSSLLGGASAPGSMIAGLDQPRGSLRWVTEEERQLIGGLVVRASQGNVLSQYQLVLLEIIRALPTKAVATRDVDPLVKVAAYNGVYDHVALRQGIIELLNIGVLMERDGVLVITDARFFGWPSRYELHALKALRDHPLHRLSRPELLDVLKARFGDPPKLVLSRRVPSGFQRVLRSPVITKPLVYNEGLNALVMRHPTVTEEEPGFLQWREANVEDLDARLLAADSADIMPIANPHSLQSSQMPAVDTIFQGRAPFSLFPTNRSSIFAPSTLFSQQMPSTIRPRIEQDAATGLITLYEPYDPATWSIEEQRLIDPLLANNLHLLIDHTNVFGKGNLDFNSIERCINTIRRDRSLRLQLAYGSSSDDTSTAAIQLHYRHRDVTAFIQTSGGSREMWVDDAIHSACYHCFLHQQLNEPIATQDEALRPTLVLMTGDGGTNSASNISSFRTVVEFAMRLGWKLEIWSRAAPLSQWFLQLQQRHRVQTPGQPGQLQVFRLEF